MTFIYGLPPLTTKPLLPRCQESFPDNYCRAGFSETCLFHAWNRWDANKHLLSTIISFLSNSMQTFEPKVNAQKAINVLNNAIDIQVQIIQLGLDLGDSTFIYHANWRRALQMLLNEYSADYDYLSLI